MLGHITLITYLSTDAYWVFNLLIIYLSADVLWALNSMDTWHWLTICYSGNHSSYLPDYHREPSHNSTYTHILKSWSKTQQIFLLKGPHRTAGFMHHMLVSITTTPFWLCCRPRATDSARVTDCVYDAIRCHSECRQLTYRLWLPDCCS